MKIYALICHNLVLTQFWPKVVSWRFEITTDVVREELALYDLMVISLSEAEAAAIGILMERGRRSRPEWDTRTHLFLLH